MFTACLTKWYDFKWHCNILFAVISCFSCKMSVLFPVWFCSVAESTNKVECIHLEICVESVCHYCCSSIYTSLTSHIIDQCSKLFCINVLNKMFTYCIHLHMVRDLGMLLDSQLIMSTRVNRHTATYGSSDLLHDWNEHYAYLLT